MSSFSRDAQLLLAAKTCRSLGYGLLSVVLGVYLEEAGFSPLLVGTLLTLSLVGSAALTALLAAAADRLGRRNVLRISSLLMVAAGLAFASGQNLWVLVFAVLSGTISATSGEVGPFETVEQAILPQTTTPPQRNRLFGWYHTLGAVAVSVGSLGAALPAWMHRVFSLDLLQAHRLMFAGYAGLALLGWFCFQGLSKGVELKARPAMGKASGWLALGRSRKIVFRLSALFALDALGGGFVVQSLLAYWFAFRFGVGGEVLGPVFLGVNFMKAVSYPLAIRLADRIGLVPTMVFTHLPSNLLLLLLPLLPTLEGAVTCLLARHLLAQMDVPARSSYIVAIVDPEERTAATGITTLVRTVTQSLGPVLAGLALQVASAAAPFFLAGGLKIVYDLALYFNFRHVRPPEEVTGPPSSPPS